MSELQEYEMVAINHWHSMQQVANRLSQVETTDDVVSNSRAIARFNGTQKRANELWDVLSADEMNYVLDNADRYL
jgi:hypothetical protein